MSIQVDAEKFTTKARLFDDLDLHWGFFASTPEGELKGTRPTETFIFVVDEVSVTLKNIEKFDNPLPDVQGIKKMHQAFFFESSRLVK